MASGRHASRDRSQQRSGISRRLSGSARRRVPPDWHGLAGRSDTVTNAIRALKQARPSAARIYVLGDPSAATDAYMRRPAQTEWSTYTPPSSSVGQPDGQRGVDSVEVAQPDARARPAPTRRTGAGQRVRRVELGKVASVGWLQDFQHVHLAELFSRPELARRDRRFSRTPCACRIVCWQPGPSSGMRGPLRPPMRPRFVWSSSSRWSTPDIYARQPVSGRQQVRFASDDSSITPASSGCTRTIAACSRRCTLLGQRGVRPHVVLTGGTLEYRDHGLFHDIDGLCRARPLNAQVHYLGSVPRDDVFDLMRQSICVLNPSLFEGWGYAVDEAASVGKRRSGFGHRRTSRAGGAGVRVFDPTGREPGRQARHVCGHRRSRTRRELETCCARAPTRTGRSIGTALYDALCEAVDERQGRRPMWRGSESLSTVSVIVPCFNARSWIGDALTSVFDQGLEDMEVIVVDDGSTDGSADLVARDFPCARLVRSDHGGPSAARNLGTRLSTGEFIQYLDADDLLAPGKLQRQLQGSSRAARTWRTATGPSCARMCWRSQAGRIVVATHRGDPQVALFTDFWCPPAAYLFRRDMVERVGGWRHDLPVIQDARFVLDCALNGGRFVYCPGEAARYRVHSTGSVSTRDPQEFTRDCLRNARSVEDWWQTHGGSTSERKRALLQVYGQVARSSYDPDRSTFEAAYAALERLEPGYVPKRPRSLRLLARFAGYRRAEGIASKFGGGGTTPGFALSNPEPLSRPPFPHDSLLVRREDRRWCICCQRSSRCLADRRHAGPILGCDPWRTCSIGCRVLPASRATASNWCCNVRGCRAPPNSNCTISSPSTWRRPASQPAR